jgi:uncharacterized membrane protein YkoI
MIHVRELSAAMRYLMAMKTMLNRRAALLLGFALCCAASGLALAGDRDDDRDHERARRALEEGRARPLAEILDRVGGQLGGEVVGVEFEREKGRYIYEFKVVAPDGRLREVYVDAMTAEILKSEDD